MVASGRHFSRPLGWALTLILVLGALGLSSGCGGSDKSADLGADAIEVVGAEGTKTYTVGDLKDMPGTEGYGGMKSSTGRITPPALVKGVLLDDLLAEVGGLPEDMAVSISAKDGYEMTLSVAQLKSGEFITYDMVTGEENKVDSPLRVIIAYEYDGRPLDPEGEGPLRLAIISPKQDQVTDGHWWVKWVTKVQVKPIVAEWTLVMTGKLTEEIDRATLESCSAAGCHGVDWADAEGNTWRGVPLYLLVGRVDDDNVHEGPAYNRDLAETGYQVRIKTADGKTVEVSSKTMYYEKNLLVAYKLNGEALSEEYWPLRLVGQGIGEADMVGQITEIEALVPAE